MLSIILTVLASCVAVFLIAKATLNSEPADHTSISILTYWIVEYPEIKAEVNKRLSKGHLTEGDFWACHKIVNNLHQQAQENKKSKALQKLKSK